MCGVPIHAAEAYLARLIRAGHRVAIAEQIESPAEAQKRGAKSVVNRAIVRVVTAGTLTEEALLDSRSANWLVAVGAGRASATASPPPTFRPAGSSWPRSRPARSTPSWRGWAPAEIDRARAARPGVGELWTAGFDSLAAERRLKERFEVATLDGFGRFDRAALCAAGGLLAYLDEVARDSLPFLRPPVALRLGRPYDDRRGDAREPGADPSRPPGTRAGSLLASVDRTRHRRRRAAARRRSRRAFARPRRGSRRGSTWSPCSKAMRALRDWLRRQLRALPDIGRALGRLVAGRGSPRDLGQLRDGLDEARRAARPARRDSPSRRPCSAGCCRR